LWTELLPNSNYVKITRHTDYFTEKILLVPCLSEIKKVRRFECSLQCKLYNTTPPMKIWPKSLQEKWRFNTIQFH
jgi:hypothetical protein